MIDTVCVYGPRCLQPGAMDTMNAQLLMLHASCFKHTPMLIQSKSWNIIFKSSNKIQKKNINNRFFFKHKKHQHTCDPNNMNLGRTGTRHGRYAFSTRLCQLLDTLQHQRSAATKHGYELKACLLSLPYIHILDLRRIIIN